MTDTDAQRSSPDGFDPRGWLSHFVDLGGGYHITPEGETSLVWVNPDASEEQQAKAQQMVLHLSQEDRAKIDEWLVSVRDFDPDAWLRRFERNGGWFMVDSEGKAQIFVQVYRNANFDGATRMQREATKLQLQAVLEARLAQAKRFNPEKWVIEFVALGGTVQAIDGRVFTGWKEEDPDLAEGAAHFRNRLIPSEVARLREFLYRKFDLAPAGEGA